VRDHCWFAAGPDGPRFGQVIGHLGYDDRVVYAGGASMDGLPAKVLHDNAMELYAERL
jgi:hypothetical protein